MLPDYLRSLERFVLASRHRQTCPTCNGQGRPNRPDLNRDGPRAVLNWIATAPRCRTCLGAKLIPFVDAVVVAKQDRRVLALLRSALRRFATHASLAMEAADVLRTIRGKAGPGILAADREWRLLDAKYARGLERVARSLRTSRGNATKKTRRQIADRTERVEDTNLMNRRTLDIQAELRERFG